MDQPDQLAGWVQQARRGDAAGFDALIDAYGSRLLAYLRRMTGREHEAEDLLQDVFVRVVSSIDKYTEDGRFEAWIFRIAANLVRDRARRRKRRGLPLSLSAGEEPGAVAEPPDRRGPLPGGRAELAEQADRLNAAMDQLPDAEREVLTLRHFGGLSFKEIAEVMGTPLGTALARSHRGLGRLRELMTDTTDAMS